VSQRQIAQRDSCVASKELESSEFRETKIVHEKKTSTRKRTDDHPGDDPALDTARSKVGHPYGGRYIALAKRLPRKLSESNTCFGPCCHRTI
jgi:hypothetical protein